MVSEKYQTTAVFSFKIFFYLILGFVTILFIYYDFQIISAPIQLEYREGSILATTDLLLKGHNPYQEAYQPLYTNIYGIVFNIVVLPLAWVFGNAFWVHRLIAGLCYFLSAALIFMVLRKKTGVFYAASAAVLFLSCQFFFTNAVARPDGLGLLLFLISILLPWHSSYRTGSLVISVAAGICAFYTKPYFVLPVIYLALYLFLFVSKKKGLVYGSLVLVLFMLSLVFARVAAPYYFFNVAYLSYVLATNDWLHMVRQVLLFFLLFGLILLWLLVLEWLSRGGFACIHQSLPRLIARSSNEKFYDLRSLDLPLLLPCLELPVFCFFLSFLMVVFSLGKHNGNSMVYLFQIMAPFLVIAAMQRISTVGRKYLVLNGLAILLNIFIILRILYPLDFRVRWDESISDWNRVNRVIAESTSVLNSAALAGELIKQNKPLIDTGQNELYFVGPTPDLFFLPDSRRVLTTGTDFRNEVNRRIREQAFDRLLITRTDSVLFDRELVRSHYTYVETYTLSMPVSMQTWEVELWLPK